MKFTSGNIVSDFFQRALFAMIFIGLLSSVVIYFYQQYAFNSSLANQIKINVDKKLKKYNKDLKLLPFSMIENDAKAFAEELGFLTIEIYSNKKENLFHFISEDKEDYEKLKLMQSYDIYLNHIFPTGKKMIFDFFEGSKDNYFLQIFYPLYKDDVLLGYIEGIAYIEPSIIREFKKTIYTTIVTVVLTIFIFALLIFPLIYIAYTKLNKSRIELLKSNITAIHIIGNAIALRDNDTDEHNYRVTLYSIKFAEIMNIDSKEIKKLIIGAFLHDVGKIGITDTILLKNTKLDEDEFKTMQAHVMKGVEFIKGNNWLSLGKDIILFHHEKHDGSGYPRGIKGENIPLITRIFSIIDVFDALTSKRPYKEAFSYDKAIKILNDGRGKHFNANILDEFIKISKELYIITQSKSKKLLQNELDTYIHKYFLDLNK
ncbi:MAG: HD-GYP domain-containing protein [Sulfurimonas sp.]|nr:HD-GYP domain-containing protein [Sulfurimonas sp.]